MKEGGRGGGREGGGEEGVWREVDRRTKGGIEGGRKGRVWKVDRGSEGGREGGRKEGNGWRYPSELTFRINTQKVTPRIMENSDLRKVGKM